MILLLALNNNIERQNTYLSAKPCAQFANLAIAIIWFSVFGATPFALLLPYANLFYTDVLMVIIGVIISSAFPAIIVYSQELLPKKLGMISGLFYGFAFGMGALGSALLGIIADYTSVSYIYQICSYLPLIGIICYFLPNLKKVKV